MKHFPTQRSAPLAVGTLILIFGLLACSSLGLPVPQTFNQRLAAGYGSVTTVRKTALVLLESHKITAEDAQNVQNQADNVRAALDLARQIENTAPAQADAKLAATLTMLQALQQYLEKQK